MDSNYKVVDCDCNEPSWEYTVRNKTRGIAAERKVVQKAGHSLASKLKPGMFLSPCLFRPQTAAALGSTPVDITRGAAVANLQ